MVQTVFIGQATSTSTATVTVAFNTGSPTTRLAGLEFSNTSGFSAVTLDTSATIDVASSGSFPSATPGHGSGELYWSYMWDDITGLAGSTSGFTYYVDPNGNPMCYNTSCGSGTQHPNIGNTDGTSGIAVLLYESGIAGAASMSGTGSFGGTGRFAGGAPLSGTGLFGGTAYFAGTAPLTGIGTMTPVATETGGEGSAGLAGIGTLSPVGGATYEQFAGLAGVGSMNITKYTSGLAGTGILGISGERLGFIVALSGIGALSIPQVAGGLVNGVGGAATPQAMPGSSQVSVAPPGSTSWQWLGTLGRMTALSYGFVCPGGCDSMSCTIMVPAAYRTQLFDPGWQVRITRGGHQVWDGKLDEPQATAQGWNLTAVGTGNRGTDITAFYSPNDVWPAGEPDEILSRAITRGLPWVSPGYNSSPYAGQFWFGQQVDPGAQTITAFLNLLCTRGGLTWYVNSQPGGLYAGDDLQIFPLPSAPNRLLVCTDPVSRTLGGDINTILIRYMQAADNTTTNTPASYNVVSVQNAQSVAAHQVMETYIDLSDVGVLTSTAAAAIGNYVLSIYQRASFAGPFTVSYGQLLNMGGQPIDPGTDQAGTVCQLILTDFGYGGEVTPQFPITFLVGAYVWDDFAQTATITPYQNVDQSLTGLLSTQNTLMVPLTAAGP